MNRIKIIAIFALGSIMTFILSSSVHARETVCERLRQLKAQQPIFEETNDNLLRIRKVKNPSSEEARNRKAPGSGSYYFLWEKNDSKVTIFIGRDYSLELSIPEYDWRAISVRWINPKLIYLSIYFNPRYGAYWIYDVEEEKTIIHELYNDGWDAWQQCSEQGKTEKTVK